jgi:hypothetical protein
VAADGSTTVKNGTYRCAGQRYAPPVSSDDEPRKIAAYTFTTLVAHDVGGYQRTMAEATLGHVWITPGPDRVPVYALGDPYPSADSTQCLYQRYTATRVKKYTTSADERAMLLAARWRDDGIVFYVPAAAGPDTVGIYTVFTPDPNQMNLGRTFYMAEGPEKDKRPPSTLAFPVLKAAGTDTQPLMRVFYSALCGRSHDELVPGMERFERIRHQGIIPFTGLLWAPLTEEKTLVVEALDKPCPYQGTMAPDAFPAYDHYEPFFTMDQLRTTVWTGPGLGDTGPNPTGEVFINGQGDGNPRPRAIGRSFVRIGPRPSPQMDWFADFKPGSTLAAFNPVPWVQNAGQRMASPDYDLTWYEIDTNPMLKKLQWSISPMLGELFVAYHDHAQDTNGKFRLTPTKMAALTKGTFVHATMEVDMMSSNRRYPQVLISDRAPNVQENLTMGTTVVVQTFGTWPIQLQVEWCDHRYWDVNNQCPGYDLFSVNGGLAPVPEISELAGLDWRVPFDVYASTNRVYVFVNRQPYGCVDLPGAGLPEGPISVTFADVLYHSGVDLDSTLWYPFFLSGPEKPNHMLLTARRHFDNLGFSSGVPAPQWDSGRFPCQTQMK